ncbi:MAG: hypothetical protein CMJ18_19085 [Phycisphaeraceae bacterium]|nr:hypothetical protein [Phycisphaeraceae bacterium]
MSHSPGKLGQPAEQYLAGWQASSELLRQGRSWSGRERHCSFLNRGSTDASPPVFDNLSAVSGLDFADDGRALAVVDWDHDGDLDLWFANRTAPRLRLMINQIDRSGGHSVAFRLRGTTCNRDAIGARVEIVIQESNLKNQRSAHAGTGFLSQSGKWLHFGLGDVEEIDAIRVHWPDGSTEQFPGVKHGGRYELVQGSGTSALWLLGTRRNPGRFAPTDQVPPKTSDAARVHLPASVPMPRLPYTALDTDDAQIAEARARPLLINLWASWCLPCAAELKQFGAHAERLRDAGVDILALSVDGMSLDHDTGPADARALLQRLEFPFESGRATPALLDKLTRVGEFLFDRHPPIGVPTSFLLDAEGRLAVIYRGRVEIQHVIEDAASATAADRRHLATPFRGRWHAPLGRIDHAALAAVFADDYPEDEIDLLASAIPHLDPNDEAAIANHYRTLVRTLMRNRRANDAVRHIRDGIARWPDSAGLNQLAGTLLQRSGRYAESIAHFEAVLAKQPGDPQAHYALSRAHGRLGRGNKAIEHLRLAVRRAPNWIKALNDLAWRLATGPPLDEAGRTEMVRVAERASALTKHGNPGLLDTLAAAYAAAGDFDRAVTTCEKAIRIATESKRAKLADSMRPRLELYRTRRPYKEK